MNAPELLVWLIPGYLTLLIFRHIFPVRSKQGYEWFIQAGGAAIPCYLVARVALWALESIVPSDYVDYLRRSWHSTFAFPESFRLLLGIGIGVPVGAFVLCVLRKPWTFLKEDLSGGFIPQPISDLFLHTCRTLQRKPVFVTMATGKVYVGVLNGYTSEIDEPSRYILIVPEKSGFRDKDTHQVVFTTQYVGLTAGGTKIKAQQILIPESQIASFGPFDQTLDESFLAAGTTKNASYKQLAAEEQVREALKKLTVSGDPAA